jgi:CRP/FNR family cyclic AMP-dependent transcriptional regulator
MATIATETLRHTGIEDVLAQLPMSTTTDYAKGRLIYGPENPSTNIYLVIAGTVGIWQVAEDGTDVLLDVVLTDELFGESAFLGRPCRSEEAWAMDRVQVMTWAVSDMEDLLMKRPRLAVALVQILVQRNSDLTRRIESFATDSVEQRLARSLLRLSERLGTPEEDGSVRMMPFTHSLLSQYVGTSRELVTQHMNQFRKQGYVSYSRCGIRLKSNPLRTVLNRKCGPQPSMSLDAATSVRQFREL